MEIIDYYAILGVEQTADLESIKKAYRKKAIANHPDNGGNHSDMKIINEAWFVLRDPITRREYDAVLGRRAEAGVEKRTENAVEKARKESANYPSNIKDLEWWLNGISSDFTSAEYSSSEFVGGMNFPTAKGSCSANLFIFIGAAIGLFYPFTFPYYSFEFPVTIFMHLFTACIGAWVFSYGHKGLAFILSAFADGKVAEIPASQPKEAKRFVTCEECGQSLRLPMRRESLLVTCAKCKSVFTVPGSPH